MASDMFYRATATIFANAELLRGAMTPAEIILWENLKRNQLNGFRFKAQHAINYFIADFYCHKAKLIVELDGNIHDQEEQAGYDKNRTYILEEFGLRVVRFQNEEVFLQLDKVLDQIGELLRISA